MLAIVDFSLQSVDLSLLFSELLLQLDLPRLYQLFKFYHLPGLFLDVLPEHHDFLVVGVVEAIDLILRHSAQLLQLLFVVEADTIGLGCRVLSYSRNLFLVLTLNIHLKMCDFFDDRELMSGLLLGFLKRLLESLNFQEIALDVLQ